MQPGYSFSSWLEYVVFVLHYCHFKNKNNDRKYFYCLTSCAKVYKVLFQMKCFRKYILYMICNYHISVFDILYVK